MGYYDYKFFHIILVLLYLYGLMTSSYNPTKKLPKIFLGISTVILFLSGFMLLGRFGIPYSGPYPMWVWGKIGIWICLAILPPIIIKRFPSLAARFNFIFVIVIMLAGFLGVFKP